MCGIFASFLKHPLSDHDLKRGRQGTEILRHRGPDGHGEWYDRDAGVFLGHRRLAIIDPETRSDQPLVRGNRAITYNGELYNFRDLKRDLVAAGRNFQTSGDTEVLEAALNHWGDGALDRFDGMFAYAYWNGQQGQLAVDAFSEKPLYFAKTSDGIHVSSEIAVLAEVLDLKPDISTMTMAGYLAMGTFPAPETAFREIQKLPPATVLVIQNGDVQNQRCYWQAPVGTSGRGRVKPLAEEELDQLSDSLIGSLERRLYADVPVSLFLSAGIDSTLVAALCVRELDTRPRAITISFPEETGSDESMAAAAIALELGLEHEIVQSQIDPAESGPSALIDLLGQPTDILSALSVQQMARAAALTHKVALTGIGGDEMFLGYGKYGFAWNRRHILDLPSWCRDLIGSVVSPFSSLSARAKRFPLQFPSSPHLQYLAIKNYPAINMLRELPDFDDWSRGTFSRERPMPLYLAMSGYDKVAGISDQQLYACDVASMRESVELRTPFLNRDVAEAVAIFDPRSLAAFGQKSILRRILGRYLPKHLYDLPKSGLIFPHDIALKNLGSKIPCLPGVPEAFSEQVWSRRNEGGNLTRIAIRLAMADVFLSRYSDSSASPP
jgi:asparagine synthase (glutamine-hydrolysing)